MAVDAGFVTLVIVMVMICAGIDEAEELILVSSIVLETVLTTHTGV